MNANFCQHLAVREQGRGGERRGADRRETGNGGFRKADKSGEDAHLLNTFSVDEKQKTQVGES